MSTVVRERLKGQSHDLDDGFAIRHYWRTPGRHGASKRYAMVEGDPEFIPLPDDDRQTLRLEAG